MEDSGGSASVNDGFEKCQYPVRDLGSFLFGDLLAESGNLARREKHLIAVLFGVFACASLQRDDDTVKLAAGVCRVCKPVDEDLRTSLVVLVASAVGDLDGRHVGRGTM